MKFLIVAIAVIIAEFSNVFSAPQGDPNGVTINRWSNDQTNNNGYQFV